VADWSNVEEQLRLEYSIAADRAFDQVSRLSDAELSALPEEYRLLARDRRAFGVNYVERLLALRPSVDRVRDSFRYDTELELLEPGVVAAGDESLLKDAAMDADLKAALGRRREKLADGFVTDVIGQMQTVMVEMAEGVLGGIEKTGKVGPSGSRSLNLVAERAAALNFYGDEDLSSILARVREIADQAPADRDPKAIASVMRAIAVIGRRQLNSIGRRPAESAAKLGVPDAPDEATVRRARRDLGLAVVEEDETLPVAAPRRGGKRAEAVEIEAEAEVEVAAPRRKRGGRVTAEALVEAVA
jgi:hypothetical protein